jgi:hypothetical protein
MTLEGFQTLRRYAERIGDREPDAFGAHVHTEDSPRTPGLGGIGLVGRHLAIICRSQLLR